MHRRPYMKIKNKVLYKFIPGPDGVVVVPDDIEIIAGHIFDWEGVPKSVYDDWEAENPPYVSAIYIPASVKSIDSEAFIDLDDGIESIIVDPACEAATVVDGCLYSKDMTRLFFMFDHNRKSLVIPVGVKMIEASAFEYCRSLTEVILPQSLEIIRENAFKWSGLKKLIFRDL